MQTNEANPPIVIKPYSHCVVTTASSHLHFAFDNQLAKLCTGFCRIFAAGMFQTSYDRAVLLWSRPIVLATTLPNKEGSWVLGLEGSVAKILQNPVQSW